jgi:hypothetical protein
MTFSVEIMLRGDHRVHVERLDHPRSPAEWTDADVADLIRDMLRAIDRVSSGGAAAEDRPVSLKGLSWIATPYQGGVAIAFEIHTASAVAGPFDLPVEVLEGMIARAVSGTHPGPSVH